MVHPSSGLHIAVEERMIFTKLNIAILLYMRLGYSEATKCTVYKLEKDYVISRLNQRRNAIATL